jgi:hypothetical protein
MPALSRPPPSEAKRERSTNRRAPDEAKNQQEHDRANEGDEDGAGQTAKGRSNMERPEDKTAQESPHNPDHDVPNETETTADDRAGQPTSDEADYDPQQERFK